MASHLQQIPSPRARGQQVIPSSNGHHQQAPVAVNGINGQQSKLPELKAHLAQQNEQLWMLAGSVSESMGDLDGAMVAYERAFQHNSYSVPALMAISGILRAREQFGRAAEFLQTVTRLDNTNGEMWSNLGHCYLMMDDLQSAYQAYQQALYHLRDPKEPKLWYGIGILYDRYGSLEYAEEAFTQVMRMDSRFDKANEIYFRLGIIYKQQGKHGESLECFKYIVHDPPRPLTEEDIWFQIGHVYEQQADFESAKEAYKRVLERDSTHAKVLQQLGWLHHTKPDPENQQIAIDYLARSVDSDSNDAQSWYLLGRCYMQLNKHPKAYEAYQQAVYRDGRNPTFWCSIGVLYYQINQYRDALDAYSRAIRINPYIPEVWYDLGTLYEACNNQVADAIDAYARAVDLDPHSRHIRERLEYLTRTQQSGIQGPHSAPPPQDIHPHAYGIVGPPQHQLHTWNAQSAPNASSGPAPNSEPWARPRQMEVRPGQPMEVMRASIPRQPSPGTMQARQYAEARQQPAHRGLSPTPKLSQPATNGFAPVPLGQMHPGAAGQVGYGSQQAPRPYQSPPQPIQPGAAEHPVQPVMQQAVNRVLNPHHNPATPNSLPAPIGGQMSGIPGSAPLSNNLPPNRSIPFGRSSPIPEIRPLQDGVPHSQPSFPQGQFQPMSQHLGGLAGGPPQIPSIEMAPSNDAAVRQRTTRPPSAAKRNREWQEDEGPTKKPASDEARMRLEDHNHRRVSSPPHRALPAAPTPQTARPPPQESIRVSNPVHSPRHEDSHMPIDSRPSLPPINISTPVPATQAAPAPLISDPRSKEVSPRTPMPPMLLEEPPTRKMEVDENYDDEDPPPAVKKASPAAAYPRSSPLVSPKSSQDVKHSVIEADQPQ